MASSLSIFVSAQPRPVFAGDCKAQECVAVGGGQAFADLVVADDDVAAFGSVGTVHGAISQRVGFAFSN